MEVMNLAVPGTHGSRIMQVPLNLMQSDPAKVRELLEEAYQMYLADQKRAKEKF